MTEEGSNRSKAEKDRGNPETSIGRSISAAFVAFEATARMRGSAEDLFADTGACFSLTLLSSLLNSTIRLSHFDHVSVKVFNEKVQGGFTANFVLRTPLLRPQ